MRLDDEFAKHWFGFPLAIRKRWWEETDFGKHEPSDELKAEVEKLIKEKKSAS